MASPATQDLWISTFLQAQAAELGAATNTLLAYGRDLKDIAAWLERRSSRFAAYCAAPRRNVSGWLSGRRTMATSSPPKNRGSTAEAQATPARNRPGFFRSA